MDKIISEKIITDNLSFVCIERDKKWKPRKGLGIKKNGEIKQFLFSSNKPLYVALNNNVTKENLEESIKKGVCLKFTPSEMIEIAKELNYFTKPTDSDLAKIIKWFIDYDEKIKLLFSNKEKEYIKTLENNNYTDFEIGLQLVRKSKRLHDSVLYLCHHGITEHTLNQVYNYLQYYYLKDDIVDWMYFSDWTNEDVDDLMSEYNINDKIIASEDIGFLSKNEIVLRYGDDYNMTCSITADFDDWEGFAVIYNDSVSSSDYVDIHKFGESLYYIEDDLYVKLGLIVQ